MLETNIKDWHEGTMKVCCEWAGESYNLQKIFQFFWLVEVNPLFRNFLLENIPQLIHEYKQYLNMNNHTYLHPFNNRNEKKWIIFRNNYGHGWHDRNTTLLSLWTLLYNRKYFRYVFTERVLIDISRGFSKLLLEKIWMNKGKRWISPWNEDIFIKNSGMDFSKHLAENFLFLAVPYISWSSFLKNFLIKIFQLVQSIYNSSKTAEVSLFGLMFLILLLSHYQVKDILLYTNL